MEAIIAAALHDIKNDLLAVDATLLTAQAEAPSPALVEARGIVSHVSARLVELLAVYRASQGTLNLPIGRCDLAEFIDEVRIEPLHVHDAQHRVAVVFEVDNATAIGEVDIDAYPVKMALIDALRNAVRFARSRVVFSVARVERDVEFSICDDGPGFGEGTLAGVETPMRPGSSGIGLLFARLIAARHRAADGREGRVLLDNGGIDGGARFRLRLP